MRSNMNGTPGNTVAPLSATSRTNCAGLNDCRSATRVPCQSSGMTTLPIAYEWDSGMQAKLMSVGLDAHRVDDVTAVVDEMHFGRDRGLRQVRRSRRELQDDRRPVPRRIVAIGKPEEPNARTERALTHGLRAAGRDP